MANSQYCYLQNSLFSFLFLIYFPLCYPLLFISATILLIFARCTGIGVYVRDSLFDYIKGIQKYRYLSYFVIGKRLWQIDSDNGHLSSQQKESNCQSWVLLLHWNLFTQCAQYFPHYSTSEKRKGKIRKRKGKRERRVEGGKPVLKPEEHGQNFFSEWQVQISYFAIKGLKILQEIYSCCVGNIYWCFLNACLYMHCTKIC